MNLYEITNGYLGESYVRVYVWAADEEQALSLAEHKYKAAGYRAYAPKHVELLFSQEAEPFCTIPSDCGFFLK